MDIKTEGGGLRKKGDTITEEKEVIEKQGGLRHLAITGEKKEKED
jgi:hypothetical protein